MDKATFNLLLKAQSSKKALDSQRIITIAGVPFTKDQSQRIP